eukprot:7572296-Pyramimonas_sp.AAC.2
MLDFEPTVGSEAGRGTWGNRPGTSKTLVTSCSPELRRVTSRPMWGLQGTVRTGLTETMKGTADLLRST